MIASLDAHTYLRARMSACSFKAGWRSLLLRAYEDPANAEAFTTPATEDHLIVLVTRGECNIEGLYRGKWHQAHYGAGSIGMTAPGEEVTLRWRDQPVHSTLQLHIPATTLRICAEELFGGRVLGMPHALANDDPLLQNVMLCLADGLQQGFPDLYAESAAQFITTHLLVRHAGRASGRNSAEQLSRLSVSADERDAADPGRDRRVACAAQRGRRVGRAHDRCSGRERFVRTDRQAHQTYAIYARSRTRPARLVGLKR